MSVSVDDIRYARSGSVNLAYHVMGRGPIDILLLSWVIPMESQSEHPRIAQFLEHLASFSRLIRFDRRGVGLSDPVSPNEPPTLEIQVMDALAILDEVRAQQACVLADNGGHAGVLLTAQHPERVTHLVLDHPTARILKSPENPSGLPPELLEHEIDTAEEEHRSGRPLGFLRSLPSVMGDPQALAWWIRTIRRGASPGTMRTFVRVLLEADVRAILPSVQAPTLVIRRRDAKEQWREQAAHVAGLIPDAKLVDVPGEDPVLWTGATEPIAEAIGRFLRMGLDVGPEHRALTTVLFTDVVDSTSQAAAFGDEKWRELLDRHDGLVGEKLARFGGRQIKTTGDGVLATFDGPARAVQCACAIRDAIAELKISMRAGLHTGEVELRGNDVSGIAVHIGQRVSALAGAGEVLVSRTVTDLVAGSGLEFDDRGEHELKGVPGRWQLFAVTS